MFFFAIETPAVENFNFVTLEHTKDLAMVKLRYQTEDIKVMGLKSNGSKVNIENKYLIKWTTSDIQFLFHLYSFFPFCITSLAPCKYSSALL